MKLWEICRFEIGYQARRAWTWIYFLVLLAISFQITMEAYTEGTPDEYLFNGPFVIASITILASVMGLLVTAALAGDAAARDVQTRMHSLVYTTPISKRSYFGGRFLAALILNFLILLGPQLALLVSAVMPGVRPETLGPFNPMAHLAAYLVIALPNAFIGAALLFSIAALSRRAIASYLGAIFLGFASIVIWQVLAGGFGHWDLAVLIDPLGLTVMSRITRASTGTEKNALSFILNDTFYLNRAIWLSVAAAFLTVAYWRFHLAHPLPRRWWRPAPAAAGPQNGFSETGAPIVVPPAARSFGIRTRVHQTVAVAAQSFREVAVSWGGFILAALGIIVAITGPSVMNHLGVPLLPTTRQMTGFVGNTGEILWMIVPLLTVYYVGELVWRDRETGMSEISDAAPLPEWVRLLGRFAGIALLFAAYHALLLVACILIQMQLGYYDFELGLYTRVMFGLQLADHLLFAMLAFAVHVVVNHKYAGHMVVIIVYGFTIFASALGIEHNLLVYGAAPDWFYSDMRGFGPSVAPFLWFKLYWGSWALLLAVLTRLFWVRGRETGLAVRLAAARTRFTRATAVTAVAAAMLILLFGGFIFYNTNVLNDHRTAAQHTRQAVEYERRYRQYEGVTQPQLAGISLRVELQPERGAAEIRGTYRLVNMSAVAIDSIHVEPDGEVVTSGMTLDRPAALVVDDVALRHRIYVLRTPLAPADTLTLSFDVHFQPRGFRNTGIDPSVSARATYFEGDDWLPAIGYQAGRELASVTERAEHGLPARIGTAALDDVAARNDLTGSEQMTFEAIIGTAADQIAIAPGALRRTWLENGRRYFLYATDVPIRNDFAIYSAAYAVRKARWQDVEIEIVHHPSHALNVDRMARSVQASLAYFTSNYSLYPHRQLRIVEHPGDGVSLHSSPVNISYQEEFSLFDPDRDPRDLDFPFAVVAHEMAHKWWGDQIMPADVEGRALLSESLAWYSAMLVVNETYGYEHMRRLIAMMREAYRAPSARAGVPLLRADGWFNAYRKGPFAMVALREYVGEEAVNDALRQFLVKHGAGRPPLPTSLDLYRELQAVTPDSLQSLLADLFEANTFWELETTNAAAVQAGAGTWHVTLDVQARKVTVDTAGVEAQVPMNDLIEVGVFAPAGDGHVGRTLYRQMHRIRSGAQRIVVAVTSEPARAGIDPRNLLVEEKTDDNLTGVQRRP